MQLRILPTFWLSICQWNWLFNSVFSSSISSLNGPRDGTLEALVGLLNKNQQIFRKWNGSQAQILEFMEMLEPWVISNTPRAISHNFSLDQNLRVKEPRIDLNCNLPKYSRVLTGDQLQSPRLIIDFVPFGYDVDKLLIRLYETFNHVDVFVVFESPVSLIGVKKPMYFQSIRRNPVFKPFLAKIIYISSNEDEVAPAIRLMHEAIKRKEKKLGDLFAVNFFMENEMVKIFKKFLLDSNFNMTSSTDDPDDANRLHRIRKNILEHLQSTLALQNDGDEIINGRILHHLKHCVIRSEVESIHTPCFSFKSNYHWLQHGNDMACFDGADTADQEAQEVLKDFLWRTGPYVWPLTRMMDAEANLRRHRSNHSCEHHMGLGAATHMSATNDPVEYWLKRCGTIENLENCNEMLSQELLAAGREGAITPSLLFKATIFPWCHKKNYAVHVSALSHAWGGNGLMSHSMASTTNKERGTGGHGGGSEGRRVGGGSRSERQRAHGVSLSLRSTSVEAEANVRARAIAIVGESVP